MPQIVEEYQSATAQRGGSLYALSGTGILANPRDSRLGIWISNPTPNSFCWLNFSGGAAKYQGINVAPGTTFFTNLYLGEISANAGINPLPLANASVGYVSNSDYALHSVYLTLTFSQSHEIPQLIEDPENPEGTPITNEVRVYGTERGAFNIQAPIVAVPDQYTIIMGAFAFITVSAVDNHDGTWTIESNIPHRFDNDGQTYYIFNGDEFNIDTIIDETHYTITSGSAVTGTIWPAPGFVSGWAQNSQKVMLGITEI